MDFEKWLEDLTGHATRRDIAAKTDYSPSTLSRQLSRGTIRPEMVIALCRAYNRSPITGLIETEYLHEHETEGVPIPYALRQATNQQILDEILRRSDPEAQHLFGGGNSEHSNVIDLDPDLAHTPWEPLPYVADNSPDEDHLREQEENPWDY